MDYDSYKLQSPPSYEFEDDDEHEEVDRCDNDDW